MTAVPKLHQLNLIECEGKYVRIIQTAASKWIRSAWLQGCTLNQVISAVFDLIIQVMPVGKCVESG